jgi:hypothetical protein
MPVAISAKRSVSSEPVAFATRRMGRRLPVELPEWSRIPSCSEASGGPSRSLQLATSVPLDCPNPKTC